ncbi:MAG: ATP-grasp domain-containing protein [Planctomycetes bacterium]|nr:ATP-grasp domain-containing protein [Planctomycetota bacterium]
MSLRVVILASRDEALAHGSAQDALAVQALDTQLDALERALVELGHVPLRVEAEPDLARTAHTLLARRPELVFHCVESLEGDARGEALVADMLARLELACTGSPARALADALQKPRARALLEAGGVALPRGFVLEHEQGALPAWYGPGRYLVKPAHEDASHGIELESVVSTLGALRARVRHVCRTYAQPALVEEFIEGREFNVSLLGSGDGARVLPLAEIDFREFPAGQPRLVTYAAKWIESSAEYRGSPSVPAQDLEPQLESRIREAALRAYRALGLAGYGRVDLRLDAHGRPLVLDVNPNPDLSPDAGLARAAQREGLSYARLVDTILHDALERAPARAARG